MWTKYDFETIENLHQESAEDYSYPHPNQNEAQTLLVSAQNLHDFHTQLEKTQGSAIGDEHTLQLSCLRRGVRAIISMYWLCKHHCYIASYGRVRFLLELYLVVREFNREKEKTKRKWQKFKRDLRNNDYGPYETLPMTDYFGGKRRQLKGELADKEELYGDVYDHLSNIASHPHSMKSSRNDGIWTKDQEEDIFRFGLIFAYALAVQYIRTFEDTDIQRFVHKEMDNVIVQVLLAFDYIPLFLEEDLEFDLLI